MLLSLLFIVLLRFLAGIMVWVMIALVILVIGYGRSGTRTVTAPPDPAHRFSSCPLGIFHCYMEYAALKGQAGANVTLQQLGFQTDFSVYLQIQQTWLAFSQYRLSHAVTRCRAPYSHASSRSDHPGHRGGRHHPPPHLPQEEDPHRHRSHQGSQQVRAGGRRGAGSLKQIRDASVLLQSRRVRDVLPVLPALHLPPPRHRHRLLGRHRRVSFHFLRREKGRS